MEYKNTNLKLKLKITCLNNTFITLFWERGRSNITVVFASM